MGQHDQQDQPLLKAEVVAVRRHGRRGVADGRRKPAPRQLALELGPELVAAPLARRHPAKVPHGVHVALQNQIRRQTHHAGQALEPGPVHPRHLQGPAPARVVPEDVGQESLGLSIQSPRDCCRRVVVRRDLHHLLAPGPQRRQAVGLRRRRRVPARRAGAAVAPAGLRRHAVKREGLERRARAATDGLARQRHVLGAGQLAVRAHETLPEEARAVEAEDALEEAMGNVGGEGRGGERHRGRRSARTTGKSLLKLKNGGEKKRN